MLYLKQTREFIISKWTLLETFTVFIIKNEIKSQKIKKFSQRKASSNVWILKLKEKP